MKVNHIFTLMATIVAISLTVVGCSGGGKSSDGGNTVPPPPPPPASNGVSFKSADPKCGSMTPTTRVTITLNYSSTISQQTFGSVHLFDENGQQVLATIDSHDLPPNSSGEATIYVSVEFPPVTVHKIKSFLINDDDGSVVAESEKMKICALNLQ